jgi:hypothetical protein
MDYEGKRCTVFTRDNAVAVTQDCNTIVRRPLERRQA